MTDAIRTRVHLERSWYSQSWNVWIVTGKQLASLDSGKIVFDREIEDGAQLPEPTLSLPDFILEALVAGAIDKMPADGSMSAHLKDAQTVRDRLLTLLEQRGIR